MDLAALVRTVISAFEDALDLVVRIRDQELKAENPALSEEATQDLLESLTLGPIIIRGHFDHDFRRFGEQYACGDMPAREQMKDVLINLQMTVITTLRSVHIREENLDFAAIQTASDDCRVNAGVCLGQLSQRLSDIAKAEAMYPTNVHAYGTRRHQKALSVASSSTRSSSASTIYTSATTPDPTQERFSSMSDTSTLRPLSEYPASPTWTCTSSEPQSPLTKQPLKCRLMVDEQIPTACLDKLTLVEADSICLPCDSSATPTSENDKTPTSSANQQAGSATELPTLTSPLAELEQRNVPDSKTGLNLDTLSTTSTVPAVTSNISTSVASRDRFGPDDFSPKGINQQSVYRTTNDILQPVPRNTSINVHRPFIPDYNSIERIKFLQENSRPPLHGINRTPVRVTSVYNPQHDITSTVVPGRRPIPCRIPMMEQSFTAGHPLTTHDTAPASPDPARFHTHQPRVSSLSDPRTSISVRTSIAGSDSIEMPTPNTTSTKSLPAIPRLPNVGQLLHRSSTNMSVVSPTSTTTSTNNFLDLPTDKNLHGFCKGAFRLQIGLEKKAFRIANRPIGYHGMMPYWKCEKCNFEGPSYNAIVVEGKKRGKAEKCFDPRVRVSATGGVRYRWSFLAKSHSTLKGQPEGMQAKDGSFGSFGCLFCCAEGGQRGWNNNNNNSNSNPHQRLDRAPTSMSLRSGSSSGVSGTAGAPIFGNVESFLEHLEIHRHEECWPNVEMLGRAKCVVGRVAADSEDWDVNFTPL